MGIVILSEIVWQAFQVNVQAIFFKFAEHAQSQHLFILYDNINFYEKIGDQRLYNKAYLVNYIARYIYFMNVVDKSTLPYINSDQVQHKVFSNLIANNFLLDQVGLNYQAVTTRFILDHALKQHFALVIRKQKYIIVGKVIPKFINWQISLKDIQCPIKKADIILNPILPLNKAIISETIDILYSLIERQGLENVVKDKVVPIKGNYLIIGNVAHALY